MNLTGLAKHYDGLTPWERFPLILAASARDDAVERDRLARSTPTSTFTVPNYYGLCAGVRQLAELQVMSLLDLTVFYWKALATIEDDALVLGRKGRKAGQEQEVEIWKMIELHCHIFVVHVDAWKTFCNEIKIEQQFLLRHLPGYDTITRMEPLARSFAFTHEESLAYLSDVPEQGGGSAIASVERRYRLDSSADLVTEWRAFLRKQQAKRA